ncbi:hypothetical protein BDP27DRAFT_1418413 [Rhodocollybia butyracea]|uniref:Uncharacterized protein n=1 Tax=Rhodocollybia butyracea TaxID=206335 RepID=A0A9P5PZS9_9AGAR|nr:hypothetical protein BDP27DRAFT_1418413 [Rhodocollybia butyracea]
MTNGHEWQFIILSINKDGNGASYKFSTIIEYSILHPLDGGDPKPLQSGPDVIAGVLLDWVQSSFDNLSEDDWFEKMGGM